jgi:hypothetical protein
MSGTAKRRIEAIGKQLSPGPTFEGIPLIKKIAGASDAKRAQGKVVIITGRVSISRCSAARN